LQERFRTAGEGVGHLQPHSRDAIVVVPGIMGSELVDAGTGRTLWGLREPQWYVSAWTSGSSTAALRLTEDEKAGRYGRVKATQLLRFPAFAPMLAGFAPYTKLLRALRAAACHPDAVAEFPYDWRLPVAHNGNLLASFGRRHLQAWRDHRVLADVRRTHPDGDQPARLVLVAHSMGGLVAWHACLDTDFAAEVRAVMTLGTPFFGAPKAVLLLASGRGSPLPLPRARLRELAAGLPGLYDLLPVYRCVGDVAEERRLTEGDVASAGGDADLAAASFAWHKSMAGAVLPGHVPVVGVHQPTVQALTFDAGVVSGHRYSFRPSQTGMQRVDIGGDGTVPSDSAQLPDASGKEVNEVRALAQSHGALAASAEVTLFAEYLLQAGWRAGPLMGAGELGLDVPEVVAAGEPFEATITGAERPTDVTCVVVDAATEAPVDVLRTGRVNGTLVARGQSPPPGLYWVRLDGGGASPVRHMIMSIGADRGDAGRTS
jgi:hypothetical protein